MISKSEFILWSNKRHNSIDFDDKELDKRVPNVIINLITI